MPHLLLETGGLDAGYAFGERCTTLVHRVCVAPLMPYRLLQHLAHQALSANDDLGKGMNLLAHPYPHPEPEAESFPLRPHLLKLDHGKIVPLVHRNHAAPEGGPGREAYPYERGALDDMVIREDVAAVFDVETRAG